MEWSYSFPKKKKKNLVFACEGGFVGSVCIARGGYGNCERRGT